MAKMASLVAGNNFLTVFGGTRLLSINGHTSNAAATVGLYYGSLAADVVAGNLVHTFLLGTAGNVNLDFMEGLDFGQPLVQTASSGEAGLIIVVTANAATFDLLAEFTAASPEA